MDVSQLYRTLANKYSDLVDKFIAKPNIDPSTELRLAELALEKQRLITEAEKEKNRERLEAEELARRQLEEQAASKVAEEFSNLNTQEKARYEYVKRYFTDYTFKNKEHLNDAYERVFAVRRKYLCLGGDSFLQGDDKVAMNNESDVNEAYAKKYIAVDHVFLIMKNMVDPKKSALDLADLLQKILSYQNFLETHHVDETDKLSLIRSFKSYADYESLQDAWRLIHLGRPGKDGEAYEAGNNIIRFYDKNTQSFMTDDLMLKQNDEAAIQLLTTPKVLPFTDLPPTLPKDCLRGFNFTFSKVFNGMKDVNNANLYAAVKGVTDKATLPVTFITYGQSGSGKSTTALYLLKQLVAGKKNFTYSAIQWYLTVDKDSHVKTTDVVHDIGKLMNKAVPTGNAFIHIGVPSRVSNLEFKFEVFNGTAVKNSVAEMENIDTFQKNLQRIKFTRSTVMNQESSRSILFFTIYDDTGKPKYSMVDLPGNEELTIQGNVGVMTLQQKETLAIKPALSMFKALFLNKQKNQSITALDALKKGADGEKKGETVTEILGTQTFGQLCTDLGLLEPYMMETLNKADTKLVLLLTSYGVTIVDNQNSADKLTSIINTSKDTFEFARTLSATQPTILCSAELDPRIELSGGKRTRRRTILIRRSRRRHKKI